MLTSCQLAFWRILLYNIVLVHGTRQASLIFCGRIEWPDYLRFAGTDVEVREWSPLARCWLRSP